MIEPTLEGLPMELRIHILFRIHDLSYLRSLVFAMCPKWMESAKWNDEILALKLSKTEKRRFLRAFYRLQIYGNLFGPIEIPLNTEPPETENDWTYKRMWDPDPPIFSEEEVWRLFFATMAPWVVEELCCFWLHCYTRWAAPYFEIADSLLNKDVLFMNELPAAEQPPVTRRYSDNNDLKIEEDDSRECLATMGPAFLVKILREPDFMTRRNLVIANLNFWAHIFVEFWPNPDFDQLGALPLLYPAEKFNFSMDFTGLQNLLGTLLLHEQPNLAWRQRWLGDGLYFPEVSVDMFSYAARAARWEWGYAIWDDERLIQWETPNLNEAFPGNIGGL